MRAPDRTRLLVRALEAAAEAAGATVAFEPVAAAPWAMGLFTGTRHQLTAIALPDAALDPFLAALPEADLPIRHGCVADLQVTPDGGENGWRRLAVTALLIED